MFILDTNVLSAMMSRQIVPEVTDWLSQKPAELLFTTSISQAEILSGIAIMANGRRRIELEIAAQAVFLEDFSERVLSFDTDAAVAYADIFAWRKKIGRPISTPDLMIASVARAYGADVVTRDIGGFEGCGVKIINPWERP